MKVRALVACVVVIAVVSAINATAQVVPATPQQTGSVTGTVRTASGAPASGIRVTAMRADSMDDALKAMVSLTQTDATGHYRLDGIPAGRYYISAGRVDLPTYFPGTLDVTRGSVLSVASATPLSDIDFVIQDTSAAVPLPGRGAFGVRGRPQPVTPFQARGRGANQVAPSPAPVQLPVLPTLPPAPVSPIRRLAVNLRSIAVQPNAAWWTNAALVARLGLTADQMKKVETTFDTYRQPIVQNTTDLAREEAALERLLEADPLEPVTTISAQIDRVVQARGELERTNSKMTLDMRQVLTRAQWVQLQMEKTQQVNQPIQYSPLSPPTPGRGVNRGNRGTP